MGKRTYLQLTNTVLKRIGQAAISDVATATGNALIITEMINEAQNYLWTEEKWYSLYATRSWNTVIYTASTIAFVDSGPDTITDSANGFGDFEVGEHILVSGSTSNDGVYVIATVAAGTLTLQTADELTAEALGESVTISAMTKPVPSDWGATIDIMDTSNNRILIEDFIRSFDEADADANQTGNPLFFSLEGDQYKMFPIINSVNVMRERYWRIPTVMTASADTTLLPIETENCIIQFVLGMINDFLKNFTAAEASRRSLGVFLKRALSRNKKMIDQMHVLSANTHGGHHGIHPPSYPSGYGRNPHCR